MIFLMFFSLISLVFSQDPQIDKALSSNDGLSDNTLNQFYDNFEVVTQPPLGDLRALKKCGEGEQFERFACVPYYNCDSDTNTIIENSENDGANKIDIRYRLDEDFKCDHYLEVCCQVPNKTSDKSRPTTSTPSPVTGSVPISTTTRRPSSYSFCGIRNTEGLDFNIIGSNNEALFGEFPWMVALLRKTPISGQPTAICGGSLITPNVVLTGAHCVDKINIQDFKIRAGEWDTQTTNERIPHQERNIVQKIIRYDYIRGNLYNDVALLILDRNLARADNVGTICLPPQDQVVESRECFATGWGKNQFGQEGRYAVILKKIQLGIVPNPNCEKSLQATRLGNKFALHKSFICAGGEPGVDTCTGDGGSPLVCRDPNNPQRYIQAGIVAWGIGCGQNQVPGVYVNVAMFRKWIDTNLSELNITTIPYQQKM